MATNVHVVIGYIPVLTKEKASVIRARGGVARTIRATRSDRGKKRK